MKRTQNQGQKQNRRGTQLYGSRAFPAQILRQNRKFPTLFENNVAITKDVDDVSDKTGQGDLAVQGARNRAFDDDTAESAARRRLDGGTSGLLPRQLAH